MDRLINDVKMTAHISGGNYVCKKTLTGREKNVGAFKRGEFTNDAINSQKQKGKKTMES